MRIDSVPLSWGYVKKSFSENFLPGAPGDTPGPRLRCLPPLGSDLHMKLGSILLTRRIPHRRNSHPPTYFHTKFGMTLCSICRDIIEKSFLAKSSKTSPGVITRQTKHVLRASNGKGAPQIFPRTIFIYFNQHGSAELGVHTSIINGCITLSHIGSL